MSEGKSLGFVDLALFRAVLDTAVDAIIAIDRYGTILIANQAVEVMFGFNRDELLGQNVKMLMPEPDRSKHDGYLKKYLETGERHIIGVGRRVFGQRRDGTLIPVDLAVSEVQVGEQRLFAGILRDMTERLQAEAELQQTQNLLIQSERLAAIGQMMTGLAHESRNALQRSRACLDMLALDLQKSPDQYDLVCRIRNALIELQTLYEEVRAYAAPIHLELMYHSVQHLVSNTWGHIRSIWEPMGVKLQLGCVECPDVNCDGARIERVIRNIFENALAVTPRSSTIYACCRVVVNNGRSFVQVAISDMGPGLGPEQMKRIFEPFFTTKTKGTGLGMPISKRLVEAHGGRIFVGDSSHRHPDATGAVLVFELPLSNPLS